MLASSTVPGAPRPKARSSWYQCKIENTGSSSHPGGVSRPLSTSIGYWKR